MPEIAAASAPVRHPHYVVMLIVARLALLIAKGYGGSRCFSSDVCLCSWNWVRIFRGGVQVRGSATYFSRPTPPFDSRPDSEQNS
jgi:hypothetical protein